MHLKLQPKFNSSTDSDKKYTMYSKSDGRILMISNDVEKTIQDFLICFCIRIK